MTHPQTPDNPHNGQQPPQPPTQQGQPPVQVSFDNIPKSQSKPKKWLVPVIIGAAVLVLALLGGGYWFYLQAINAPLKEMEQQAQQQMDDFYNENPELNPEVQDEIKKFQESLNFNPLDPMAFTPTTEEEKAFIAEAQKNYEASGGVWNDDMDKFSMTFAHDACVAGIFARNGTSSDTVKNFVDENPIIQNTVSGLPVEKKTVARDAFLSLTTTGTKHFCKEHAAEWEKAVEQYKQEHPEATPAEPADPVTE